MDPIINNKLKLLIKSIQKNYTESWKQFAINGNTLWLFYKSELLLNEYINKDFLDFSKYEFETENIQFLNLLKLYLINLWFKDFKIWTTVHEEESHFSAFCIKWITWTFYISWFLK